MGAQLPGRRGDGASTLQVESIRARTIVMEAWSDRLAALTGERRRQPESKAVLNALQFGSYPPRHSADLRPDLLAKLKHTLARQIDLIVETAALDESGLRFYGSLKRDLAKAVPGDPIGELLGRVSDKARSVYGQDWIVPESEVVYLGRHPRASHTIDGDPYTATAETDLEPRPQVKVRILGTHFGVEAYCSLPMIITHEFVSHVPSYPRRNSQPGLFNEGFMDWASLTFFRHWCHELSPTLNSLVLSHGDELHRRLLHEVEDWRGIRGTTVMVRCRRRPGCRSAGSCASARDASC